MQMANASVSTGSCARLRIERTREGEGSRNDTAEGIRLDKCTLGPK